MVHGCGAWWQRCRLSVFWDRLSGFWSRLSFRSLRGEFRLTPTAGGGTLLEGSTWYVLDMGPAPYWKLWGDAIVHRIHERVLAHIKELSEE